MAQAIVPPVSDLVDSLVDDVVGVLPSPPAPRVAHHDGIADQSVEDDARHARRTRWLRPALDITISLLMLALITRGGTTLEPAVLAAVALAWPTVLASSGWFVHRPLGEPRGTRLGRALRAGSILAIGCWLANLVLGQAASPATLVPVVGCLTLAALVSDSVVLPGEGLTRIVLAGHPEDIRHAMAELARSPRRFVVAGACVASRPEHPLGLLPMCVGVSCAAELARETRSDALLLLPGPDLTPAALRRLEWEAESVGLPLYVGTGLLDVSPTRISVVQGAGLDVLRVRPAPRRGPRRVFKSVAERLVAALALLLLMPVLTAIWALVRAETHGPGLFRQRRVGRDGVEFTMIKFRTMTQSAPAELVHLAERNESDGVLFKIASDPRCTRLGLVLRKYSIDELPQLWNVVVGQMSLVGPRPALPEEVARYDVDPRRRLAVKPGLTGLWQVSGRSDLSWAETVRLDVKYVDNWSLSLDLSILLRTFKAVISHRGAY